MEQSALAVKWLFWLKDNSGSILW